MGRLDGKVAIITGGTSGIGAATAEVFAKEGAKVVIAGRSEEKGQRLADRLGENVVYQWVDVTREEPIQKLIDGAVARFGRLDCLFNNAGGLDRGGLETVTEADFQYSMGLLLGSVVFGIKHAARVMKPQGGGSIINNSSVAALRNGQGGYLYGAAKAGVTRVTQSAGIELGPFGIRVNCISPGAVATPIFYGGSEIANTMDDETNAKKMEKLTRNLAQATPLKQAGLPRDVALAALYLACDEGRFINCHDLVVDGGRIAWYNEPPRG